MTMHGFKTSGMMKTTMATTLNTMIQVTVGLTMRKQTLMPKRIQMQTVSITLQTMYWLQRSDQSYMPWIFSKSTYHNFCMQSAGEVQRALPILPPEVSVLSSCKVKSYHRFSKTGGSHLSFKKDPLHVFSSFLRSFVGLSFGVALRTKKLVGVAVDLLVGARGRRLGGNGFRAIVGHIWVEINRLKRQQTRYIEVKYDGKGRHVFVENSRKPRSAVLFLDMTSWVISKPNAPDLTADRQTLAHIQNFVIDVPSSTIIGRFDLPEHLHNDASVLVRYKYKTLCIT